MPADIGAFDIESECDIVGLKGRLGSVECYLDGEVDGVRQCRQGLSDSKWFVWGMLVYSVMSVCIASCGILACCCQCWGQLLCPDFADSLSSSAKGVIWRIDDD